MKIREELLPNEIVRIYLSGRMDIEGVGQIEIKLAGMTASPRHAIVVDMSEVEYMASIGIRALVMNAKAVTKRGGKLVLLNPQANVRSVLASSGIDQIIPVYDAVAEAIAAVAA